MRFCRAFLLFVLVSLGTGEILAADRVHHGPPPSPAGDGLREPAPVEKRAPVAAAIPAAFASEVFPAPALTMEEARAQLEAMYASDTSLLFEGARFDPLLHGEPDLSAFVPPQPGEDDLPAAQPRLAIVQFHRAPGASERASLLSAGATPLFYVPHRAYLVRADAQVLARLAGEDSVRWVGRYRPGYKLDNALGRMAAGIIPQKRLPGEAHDSMALDLLIAPQGEFSAVVEDIRLAVPGAEIVAEEEAGSLGVVTLFLPLAHLKADLARLAAVEDVIAVEGHGEVKLHNDDAVWIGQSYDIFSRQDYPQSATIWKHGLLGEGEIIGVADSGVDPDTCWLEDTAGLPPVSSVPAIGAGRGPIPVDPTRRKIIAYNLLGSHQAMATAYDVRVGDPHGTWVAIAAAGDNPDHPADESDPVGNHHDFSDGMAPAAKLVIEDLGDDNGELVGLSRPIPRMLDQLFEQMRDAGVRISTNSWGIEGNQYDLFSFFADRMSFNHPDFLMLFSVGNSGPYPGSLASPATAKNVLAVGASEARIHPGDDLDPENLGLFSGRGPSSDGRIKPDLVISGSRLVTGNSDLGETGRSCDTIEVSGTSFAAPIAAGFAALAREYYRKGFYPTGIERSEDGFLPSAALLRATLIAGARNMTGRGGPDYSPCNLDTCDVQVGLCHNVFLPCEEDADCSRCDGNMNLLCSDFRDCDLTHLQDDAPALDQGWGRLHLDNALYFDGDNRGLALWDLPREAGLGTGETWAAEFYVDSTSEDLQLVLTWPDPPALVASPTYLVNDLDLRVIAPDGTVYWGNAWTARDRNPFIIEYSAANQRPSADIDTVEMVRLQGFALDTGIWRVEVYGDSVPGSPLVDSGARQDFAVVAVGPVSTRGGTVSLDASSYSCGGQVAIEVLDSNAVAPLSVSVSTGSGDSETLALSELGGGRFAGNLSLASGQVIATENGSLEVTNSESIEVVYDDSDPVLSASASAQVNCTGSLQLGPIVISGGCDEDAFLDAGESVELLLSLVNSGVTPLSGVSATLSTSDGDLFVEVAESSFGSIPPGASAVSATPFRLSLRDGAQARQLRTLELEIRADGSTLATSLPVPLSIETDELRTEDTWTEDFTSAPLECHDGSAAAPTDSWYFFDLNEDCATSEDTWEAGFCFGNPMAMMPSCNGTWLSAAQEKHHRLVSPHIVTGSANSTTILKTLRFTETYHLLINEDGKLCDRTVVELFTNRDGRLLPSTYYRDRSADATDEIASLDLTSLAEFSLPPLPDGTELQLIFHVASNDKATGANSCTGSTGDEYRWRVDDIELDYENIELVDDQGACPPGCTAPPAPEAATATNLGDSAVLVGWDPSAAADHYDVYRSDGSEAEFVARVMDPESAWIDKPGNSGPWTYSIEAVDASGLCASEPAETAPWQDSLACSTAAAAPAGFAATDDAAITCQLGLTWQAVTPPCGASVLYRIYRSLDPEFVPDPSKLLAETSATSYTDSQLSSGWDDDGEPSGEAWTYEVRAVDSMTHEEGEGARITQRAGGARQAGTWIDDGGDDKLPKMTSITLMDELGAGAGWSRSPFALHHGGAWSYWSDEQASGVGRYEALSCLSLVSPGIELEAASNPRLKLWVNYDIEYQWDGIVVEVAGDDGTYVPIDPLGGYPGSFASTVPPPCQGDDTGSGDWINGCDYPPSQGAITGPELDGISGWEEYSFDVSVWDGETIAFRVNLSTDCGTDGGAVLDDFSVTGALLPTACDAGSCLPPPAFAGLIAAIDLDQGLITGIELSWGDVPDWGGGGSGSFEIYRDGELLATATSSSRSYVDDSVDGNRTVLYQVVARSGSGCELPSEDSAAIRAMDCGEVPSPDQAAAWLEIARARSGSTVILRTDLVAGAASYRFPWSHSPSQVSGSSQRLESTAPETRHAVQSDGLNYFYLVEGAPAAECP